MSDKLDYFDRDQQVFNDIPFRLLMQKRIVKVLLLCSSYDAFLLEEDGHIEALLADEYAQLNLRFPPEFIHCATPDDALNIIMHGAADMVVVMAEDVAVRYRGFAQLVKDTFPLLPITALTSNTANAEPNKYFDYVFAWQGDIQVMLAAIKLAEDRLNAKADVASAGVQVILVVEDSVRFYSSYLSTLYSVIYRHTKAFRSEELNSQTQNLIMRGRPKILLATDFEQAMILVQSFAGNILGVITDASFPLNGEKCTDAGIRFAQAVRANDCCVPILLQSMDTRNAEAAHKMGIDFLSKTEPDLPWLIAKYFSEKLAFGDFEFKTEVSNTILARASNLVELAEAVQSVDARSLLYHSQRNDFSRWLKARAQFQLSQLLEPVSASDFTDTFNLRSFIVNAITVYRQQLGRTGVLLFSAQTYGAHIHFARAGAGSMGGKARGLAFCDNILSKYGFARRYTKLSVAVPRTLVLCSGYFDLFMEINHLHEYAFRHENDAELIEAFESAQLPEEAEKAIRIYAQHSNRPIAVRSSSLLEDSARCSFAGIYHTEMVFMSVTDHEANCQAISRAVKSVYASVFTERSRSFAEATSQILDEEKMAVILQEVCGDYYGENYFPALSGIASSRNYYPSAGENARDGVCQMAIGLGSYVAEGGQCIRFSPANPQRAAHFDSPRIAVSSAQKHLHAITCKIQPSGMLRSGATTLPLRNLLSQQPLARLCSVYDPLADTMSESPFIEGIRIPTFASLLQYGQLPVAEAVKDLLQIGEREMGYPVEIEFAVHLCANMADAQLMLLQMRPMPARYAAHSHRIGAEQKDSALIFADTALGNGIIRDLPYIVFLSAEAVKNYQTESILSALRRFNQQCLLEGKKYIIAGPGRWGSSDASLGLPVQWTDISEAAAIAELPMPGVHADFSRGSHFFHNLVANGVIYLSVQQTGISHGLTVMAEHGIELFPGVTVLTGSFTVIADGETQQTAVVRQ